MHTSAQDRALWGRSVPQWSYNTWKRHNWSAPTLRQDMSEEPDCIIRAVTPSSASHLRTAPPVCCTPTSQTLNEQPALQSSFSPALRYKVASALRRAEMEMWRADTPKNISSGEGFLPGSFQNFMWEFRLSAMLQHIGDECNKTNWYSQTTHKQQAFSTELVTSYELILLYFYSPRPYSMFKVKSFKACALLTSTCCLAFTHGKTTDRTALSEQNRNPDKFSQTKYTEFVLRARVALRIMDQHSHWQVLPLFTTSLQHSHLCIRFLNNKLQQFQKLQKKTYV